MPGNWKKKTFVQTIFQILTWKVLLVIKNMFIMKNLTDFRKTMETGVDPRLVSHAPRPLCACLRSQAEKREKI